MRPIPSLSRKLVSVSGFAIATAMLAQAPAAQAQSFQVNSFATFGSVTISTGTNTTNIDVNSNSAVINWVPSDTNTGGGSINFQPTGTTATFTGTSGSGLDFAVLNRIIPVDPTRPIQFNGTVNSEINISGSIFPGGNIFFFSPGGIILGSTATFDIGSLALTTLDLAYDTGTGAFDTLGAYEFQQATIADSKVRVLNGAQISTTDSGTYVALVAPSVTNDGSMIVDGSVAMVAADAATLRFSPNGLFDIQVTSGTSSTATVVANGGSITGPVGNVNNNHRVYMVAVPKNVAISMAIGGGSTLGFDIAGAADVVGNAVILSGGYNIAAGVPDTLPSPVGTGPVSINGLNADITSGLFARTTGVVNLGAESGASLNFASDVTIYAGGPSSSLFSDTGGAVTVAGDFLFDASSTSFSGNALGNDVIVRSDGAIDFSGDVTLTSIGQGAAVLNPGATGGEGAGGSTQISAINGGQVTVAGNVSLDASGLGGVVSVVDGTGGRGFGGFAELAATGTGGSLIQITGSASLIAEGIGGDGFCSTCVQFGGNGDGGEIGIEAVGNNTVTIGAGTTMRAVGVGGLANGATAIGGTGVGGQGYLTGSFGGDLSLHGTTLTVDGNGGNAFGPGTGGFGQGGLIEVTTSGVGTSTATFNGSLALAADGRGGTALIGGVAGNALGGSIITSATDGSTLNVTGNLSQVASGLAGSGQTGPSIGTGGDAAIEAESGGTILVGGNTDFFTIGVGGNLEQGGAPSLSIGGLSEISLSDGGIIDLGAQTVLNAYALGSKVSVAGLAGSAQGGTARITGLTGAIFSAAGFVELNVMAEGGDTLASVNSNIQGGNATGGEGAFSFFGGSAFIGTNLSINAYGLGGLGDEFDAGGVGGNGNGGLASLVAGAPNFLGNGASITVNGTTSFDVNGVGEDGLNGGAGVGGQAFVYARQGNLALGDLSINARGEGSDGTSPGVGGSAIGGLVEVVAHSAVEGPSQIVIGTLFASASSDAGDADDPGISNTLGGNGAFAQGGSVLVAGSAGNGLLQTGDVSIRAHATGGFGGIGNDAAGGNGGDAIAGSVRIGLISGLDTGPVNLGTATFGTITARASGTGGDGGFGSISVAGANGGNGGDANGGSARLIVEGGLVTINGTASWEANASGGQGGSGDTTGNGGNAMIGSANPLAIGGSSAFITSRAGRPAQRGNLVAQDLIFASSASEGSGLIDGTQTKLGSAARFVIKDSSVDANSISLFSLANDFPNLAFVDPVSLTNSTVTVNGLFQLNSSTSTSLTLDQSTLSAGSVAIGAENWVFDPIAPTTFGTLSATGPITLTSGLDLVAYANISSAAPVSLNAVRVLDLGDVTSGDYVSASAGTMLSLNNISSGDYLELSAVNGISVGNLDSGHSVNAGSGGNITTGNIIAGNGLPRGPNSPPSSVTLRSDASIITGTITTPSDLSIFADSGIVTGQAAANDMLLLSGGSVSTGGLGAAGRVLIANASMEVLGITQNDFDPDLVFSANTVTPTPGAIAISGPVTATSFSAATLSNFNGGAITVTPSAIGSGNFRVDAGAAFAATDILVANMLQINANGAITAGNLQSNTMGVKVASLGGSIATNGISARNDVLLSASQALTVAGPINARDVLLLSGSDVTVNSILAGAASSAVNPNITNATGTVLISGNSPATSNFLLSHSVDYTSLLAAAPIRSGGAVILHGPVVAGRVVSFNQGNMTAAAITAYGSLEIEAGGLITVGQLWTSPLLTITSADISVINNGSLTDSVGRVILSGLRTDATGSLRLTSISTGQTMIGDGLTGSGYALSAAEMALISTGDLSIGASSNSASAARMQIGNLALTAGGSIGESILAGSNGRILFASGNRDTQTPGGAIRIVGSVSGTGFAGTNVLEFVTGRFELDAATASLSLTQTGTALGGTVEIAANNIHVASGTILDRLASDPFYTGHANDLNQPAAVQRPEGVLRALGLDLYPTGTLYIQNTGTSLDPAGFFADFELTDLNPPANASPASISVIVNGKWQTAAGIVSGVDARDLVVDNAATLAFYTADSSINGCAVNASACVATQEVDPTPAIAGQIAIVSNDVLGNTPQFAQESTVVSEEATEEAQEEAEAAAAAAVASENATSPIAPTPQIINTSALEQKSTIDQPVAGSGNPSLIGSVVNEASAEGNAQ